MTPLNRNEMLHSELYCKICSTCQLNGMPSICQLELSFAFSRSCDSHIISKRFFRSSFSNMQITFIQKPPPASFHTHTNVTPYLLLVLFPWRRYSRVVMINKALRMHCVSAFQFSALLHLPRLNLDGLPAIVVGIGRRILYILLARLAKYHV